MKKIINFVLLLVVLAGMIAACDDQKTMQEYLREESKAIERYIASQGINVQTSYPKDSIFAPNEYFKTSDGLYMHVVSRGNTARRIVPYKEWAQVRFDYYYYIKSYVSGSTDSIVPSFNYFPFKFMYGVSGSYAADGSGLPCNGWAIPLQYVGEGGIVDLIIPSSLGNSTDNSSFQPIFYKNLQYTKFTTGF
ncbi:hypothetical protein FACS1894162_6010 [Bacteroidia bacterium]|nr:hypothetical protein FACS1894162_6010 [Bacteroidia bacterium]